MEKVASTLMNSIPKRALFWHRAYGILSLNLGFKDRLGRRYKYQKMPNHSRMTILGLGGLGSRALYLAAAGAGNILLLPTSDVEQNLHHRHDEDERERARRALAHVPLVRSGGRAVKRWAKREKGVFGREGIGA